MVVVCEVCKKEFKYPSQLKRHENAKKKCRPKENETNPEYECQPCVNKNDEENEDIYDRGEGKIPYPTTAKERMNILGLLMIKILQQCVDYRNENYVKENKENVGEAIRELTKKFEFELNDV